MTALIPLFIAGALALLVIFTVTWLVQLRTKNAAIVDAIWSASFPLLATLYFVMVDGYRPRQLLLLGTVCMWGLRLAIHLLIRTAGHPEDARYTALRKEWGEKQNILMLRFYYFQAILALVLSIPFALITINTTPHLTIVEIGGAVLWLIALIGESVADYQLKKFKEDPINKGNVFEGGLWYYSRHPNYFFEWLHWWTYVLLSVGAQHFYLSLLGPFIMFILIV